MTKWIVIGVVLLGVLVSAAGYFVWDQRQDRFTKQVYPLIINQNLSIEQREQAVAELREKLSEPELLEQVVRESGIVANLKSVSSEEEGRSLIEERLLVELAESPDSIGAMVPSIHIGVRCKIREAEAMAPVAEALMSEVNRILREEAQALERHRAAAESPF